jgi:hypothetical protein
MINNSDNLLGIHDDSMEPSDRAKIIHWIKEIRTNFYSKTILIFVGGNKEKRFEVSNCIANDLDWLRDNEGGMVGAEYAICQADTLLEIPASMTDTLVIMFK